MQRLEGKPSLRRVTSFVRKWHMTANNNTPLINRRRFLGASLAGGLAMTAAPVLLAQGKYPLANTRSGKIRGVTEHNIHIFRGIPYGADTRSRRFMSALPEEKWSGTR